jgi:hypothetical protein
MNTVKKIKLSTLFALVLIGQSHCRLPASEPEAVWGKINVVKSPNSTLTDRKRYNHSILTNAQSSMYNPINIQAKAGGYMTSNLQNTSQNAHINNKGGFQNKMTYDDAHNSDIGFSFTNNSSAMNSNTGSHYNSSKNNIDTKTQDNSNNQYTTDTNNTRTYTAI